MSADEILEKLYEAGGLPALAASALTAAWMLFRGKNQAPEWASKADVDAITKALVDLHEELAAFTKEVREAMVSHGERIAKSEARLEERKK